MPPPKPLCSEHSSTAMSNGGVLGHRERVGADGVRERLHDAALGRTRVMQVRVLERFLGEPRDGPVDAHDVRDGVGAELWPPGHEPPLASMPEAERLAEVSWGQSSSGR